MTNTKEAVVSFAIISKVREKLMSLITKFDELLDFACQLNFKVIGTTDPKLEDSIVARVGVEPDGVFSTVPSSLVVGLCRRRRSVVAPPPMRTR